MKISILTLGCKTNQAESSDIEANLSANGFDVVDLSEKPEICIINTCSVTAKSDYQSRQLIRRAHNAGASVYVTGCYSELNRDLVLSMKGVNAVIENRDKFSIIKELTGRKIESPLRYGSNRKSRFFLKVQDGCSFSCSYCIIPKARGRSRSIKIEEIVDQVNAISGHFHEIVLTGIHLGTYGYDLLPKAKLSDLLQALLSTKIRRIRLSSLEITEVKDDILELMEDDRICRHLHIPLQSGDDVILELMNRTYTSGTFIKGIEHIIRRSPDISIGTDVIVGFPGESEEAFQHTSELLGSLPIAYFHVFPFSPRQGTKAADMELQVPPEAKRQRSSVLRELSRDRKKAFMQTQIGKTLDVLIEEKGDDGFFIGTAGNYMKVKAMIDHPMLKGIVDIRIVGHDGETLIGAPINTA